MTLQRREKSRMLRNSWACGRRLRIARGVREEALRSVLAAVPAGSDARIELVLATGQRLRIARGLDEAASRSLVESAFPGSDARIELVLADGRRLPRACRISPIVLR